MIENGHLRQLKAMKALMKAHMIQLLRAKKRDHMCKFCDTQFGWKSELKKHIDTKHLGREQKKKVALPKTGTKKKLSKGDVKKKLRAISKEGPVENVKKEATEHAKKYGVHLVSKNL